MQREVTFSGSLSLYYWTDVGTRIACVREYLCIRGINVPVSGIGHIQCVATDKYNGRYPFWNNTHCVKFMAD